MADLIERFDASAIMWSIDGIEPKPSPSGEWVRFTDYEALRTRLAEVEKARDAAETKRLAAWEDWRKLIDAILEPSPMCRDCADEFGTCPASGLPCDTTDRAIAIHNRKKARAETAESDAAKLEAQLERAEALAGPS